MAHIEREALSEHSADESIMEVPREPETTPYGPREVIECAEQDPRFDTFIKRLSWFQAAGESDKDFAERIGISHSTLRRWKRTGESPQSFSVLDKIARNLDVSFLWLYWGRGHKRSAFPNGKTRLTSIPRFQPWYQFTDHVGDDEPRSFSDCYSPDVLAKAV